MFINTKVTRIRLDRDNYQYPIISILNQIQIFSDGESREKGWLSDHSWVRTLFLKNFSLTGKELAGDQGNCSNRFVIVEHAKALIFNFRWQKL